MDICITMLQKLQIWETEICFVLYKPYFQSGFLSAVFITPTLCYIVVGLLADCLCYVIRNFSVSQRLTSSKRLDSVGVSEGFDHHLAAASEVDQIWRYCSCTEIFCSVLLLFFFLLCIRRPLYIIFLLLFAYYQQIMKWLGC